MNPNTCPTLVKTLHKGLYGIALPILLASCGGGGDSPPTTPTPTLAAPDLTDAPDQTYTAGQAIPTLSFPSSSSGGAVASCRIATNPALPMGLKLNASGTTCQITGTPATPSGEATYTITATNTAGSDTAMVKITVNATTTTTTQYTILDSMGVSAGNFLSSVYTTDGSFDAETTTSSADGAGGDKLTWSETGGVITVEYLAAPGTGLFVNQFDADPTADPAKTMDLSAYAQGSLVFEIRVPNYGAYTSMIVKADSPPSCSACDQVLGKVGDNFWETVSIPISNFPRGMTPETQLDLTQVSASFVISPDARTQQTQATFTFMLRDIRWEPTVIVVTPKLANIDSTIPLTVNLGVVPIKFSNDGVDVAECSVAATTPLPAGLEVEVADNTCQIVGKPMATTTETTYTILATAATSGRTNMATVTFAVNELPTTPTTCALLEEADVTGYPVDITGYSKRLYVRGNLSNGQAHPNFIFRHKGNNTYQAAFTLDSALATGDYDPANTAFKVASDDGSLTTQFNVIDDTTSNVVTTPLNLNQRYDVDRSNGQGLNGNNPVALQANASYVFTLDLGATANPADGEGVGELYIQDCSQNNAPPIITTVSTKNFLTNQESVSISFANSGGLIPANGCSVSPALPTGLSLAVVNGTCTITGVPTESVESKDYTLMTANAEGSATDIVFTLLVADPSPTADRELLSSTGFATGIFANNVHSPSGAFTAPPGGDTAVSQDATNGPKLSWTTTEGVTTLTFANTAGASFWSLGFSNDPATNPPATEDFSAYAAGFIAFDVMVPDGYDASQSLVFGTNSFPTCATCTKDLGKVGDGFWQTIVVNVADFADFDPSATSAPFILSPDTPSQLGTQGPPVVPGLALELMVQNIRWTNNALSVPNAPAFTSPADQTYAVGNPVSLNIANTGETPRAGQCSSAPDLPDGLSLTIASGTCQITGTPGAVADAQNYTISGNNFGGKAEATVMITVEKGTDRLSFPTTALTATVGDTAITTQVATTASTQGMITYESSVPAVATVDPNSGEVTIVTAGETIITATRVADANYLEATASYTLTVEAAVPLSYEVPHASIMITPSASAMAPVGYGTPLTLFDGTFQNGFEGLFAFEENNPGDTPATAMLGASGDTNRGNVMQFDTGTATMARLGLRATTDADATLRADISSYTLLQFDIRITDAPDDATATYRFKINTGASDNTGDIEVNLGGQVQLGENIWQTVQVALSHAEWTAPAAFNLSMTEIIQVFPSWPKGNGMQFELDNVRVYSVSGKETDTLSFAGVTNDAVAKTFGDAGFIEIAGGGNGMGMVTYASSVPDVATVDATGAVTIVSAGETIITATRVEDDNYLEATASYTLTVNPADDTLSFANTVDDNSAVTIAPDGSASVAFVANLSFTRAATATSTRTEGITYASSDMDVATVDSSGVVMVLSAGQTNITANLGASGNYNAAFEVMYFLNITDPTKQNDTLTFAGMVEDNSAVTIAPDGSASVVFAANLSFTRAVTVMSTRTGVAYASSAPAVATVDATTGEVAIVSVGETAITATLAGDTTYNLARESYVLTVNPQAPILGYNNSGEFLIVGKSNRLPITFTNAGGAVADDGCEVSSGSGIGNDELPEGLSLVVFDPDGAGERKATCRIEGIPTATIANGQYKITATNTGGSFEVTINLGVAKGTDTLSFADVVNDAVAVSFGETTMITQVATGNTGDGALSYEVLESPSGMSMPSVTNSIATVDASGVVTIAGEGEVIIQAKVAESDNYNEVTAMYTLTVNPPAPILADNTETNEFTVGQSMIPAISFVNEGGDIQASGCTVSPVLPAGLTVANTDNNQSCEITGAPTAALASDVYTITATNGNGLNTDTATVTIVVGKGTDTLSFANMVEDNTAVTIAPDGSANVAFAANLSFTRATTVMSGRTGVAYASSTPAVATVNPNSGEVTLVSAGETIITATLAGDTNYLEATASYTLTVTDPTKQDDTLTFAGMVEDNSAVTIAPDGSASIVFDAANLSFTRAVTVMSGRTGVTYASSAPAVATVVPNSGEVTLVSAGETMITATLAGDTTYNLARESYTLTVHPPAPILMDMTSSLIFTVGVEIPVTIFTNDGGDIMDGGCEVSSGTPVGGGVDTLPAGLVLDLLDNNCQITGRPTRAATEATYEITAENTGGTSSATVTITVVKGMDDTLAFALPTAGSGGGFTGGVSTVIATYGTSMSYTRVATSTKLSGSPVFDYTISGAEGVITADIATIIAATGAVTITGVGEVTITATLDDPNYEGMVSYTLTVNPPAPVLADVAGTQTFAAMVEIDPIIFTNDGGDVQADAQGCQFTSSSGSSTMLPAGLTLAPTTEGSPRTCQITGTPMAAVESMQYTITGRNIAGTDIATVTILIHIAPPVLVAPNPATVTATVGVAIDPIIFTNEDGSDIQENGCEFVSSSIHVLGLVVSVSDDNRNCVLTGVPRRLGAIEYEIRARNAGGPSNIATVIITVVNPEPPVLVAPSPATGVVGVEITDIIFTNTGGNIMNGGCQLTSSGGATNALLGLVWSVSEDDRNCVLSGTPTEAGEIIYAVTATNAGGPSSVATVTITVAKGTRTYAQPTFTTVFSGLTSFEPQALTGEGDGAVTYAVLVHPGGTSNPSTDRIATVDNPSSGVVTIVGIGTVIIQATITEGANYLGGTAMYTLIINLRPPMLRNLSGTQMLTVEEEATLTFLSGNGGPVQDNGCVAPQWEAQMSCQEG